MSCTNDVTTPPPTLLLEIGQPSSGQPVSSRAGSGMRRKGRRGFLAPVWMIPAFIEHIQFYAVSGSGLEQREGDIWNAAHLFGLARDGRQCRRVDVDKCRQELGHLRSRYGIRDRRRTGLRSGSRHARRSTAMEIRAACGCVPTSPLGTTAGYIATHGYEDAGPNAADWEQEEDYSLVTTFVSNQASSPRTDPLNGCRPRTCASRSR